MAFSVSFLHRIVSYFVIFFAQLPGNTYFFFYFKIAIVSCIDQFRIFFFLSLSNVVVTEVQATMRAWLLVIAVLATFQPIVQVASTEDSSSSSSVTSTQTSTTNKNQLNRINNEEEETTTTTIASTAQQQQQPRTKPDPETQVKIEENLLSLFGMTSRPRSIDRSKVIIPEAMTQLYAEITGQELRTTNLPKPGLHTKSANTVRSFQHEGNYSPFDFIKIFVCFFSACVLWTANQKIA